MGSRSEIKTHFFQGLLSVQFHRLHLIESMQREDQGPRHVNRQLVKALDLGGLGIYVLIRQDDRYLIDILVSLSYQLLMPLSCLHKY